MEKVSRAIHLLHIEMSSVDLDTKHLKVDTALLCEASQRAKMHKNEDTGTQHIYSSSVPIALFSTFRH